MTASGIDNSNILKSFSWVTLANIITKPLWFLLFIYAARRLGTTQFGIYTLASSIVTFATIIIDFGLDYIAIGKISQNTDEFNEQFNKVILIRSVFFFVILFLLIGYTLISTNIDPTLVKSISLTLVFQATTIFLTFIKASISAFQEFRKFSFMLILEKSNIIILGFFTLLFIPDLLLFLISISLANIITLIIFICYIKRRYSLKFYIIKSENLLALLKESFPILVMNIFIMTYFRVDVIILDLFSNNKATLGIYGAIHRIVEMYILIPTILMTVAYPIINKYLSNEIEFVKQFTVELLKILISVTLPIVVVIAFNSYTINKILFGSNYIKGSEGLIFIIWTILPLGLNYILGHMLISLGKQKLCAQSVAIAAIFNIVINIVLIPIYSFKGTCIAAFISEVIILFFYSFYINRFLPDLGLPKLFAKVIIVIIIIFTTYSIMINYFSYNFIFGVAIMMLTSIILLLLFNFVNLKEINKFIKF